MNFLLAETWMASLKIILPQSNILGKRDFVSKISFDYLCNENDLWKIWRKQSDLSYSSICVTILIFRGPPLSFFKKDGFHWKPKNQKNEKISWERSQIYPFLSVERFIEVLMMEVKNRISFIIVP